MAAQRGIGEPTRNRALLEPTQNVKQQPILACHHRVVRQQKSVAASDGVGIRAGDRAEAKQAEPAAMNSLP